MRWNTRYLRGSEGVFRGTGGLRAMIEGDKGKRRRMSIGDVCGRFAGRLLHIDFGVRCAVFCVLCWFATV